VKAGLILAGLLFFIGAARADTTFYGAWYTVWKPGPEAKDSGGATIILRGDITNPENETGLATISATVNAHGAAITFNGRWTRARNHSLRVEFGPDKPTENGTLSWHGAVNLNSGQCSGSWIGVGARGRFQTRRQ